MSPKLGRNERCWCDSGKKYKRCCLQSDQQQMKASATVLNTGRTKNHFSHLRTVTAPASKESDTNWRRSEFSNRSTEKVARRKTEIEQRCEVALLRSVDWIEDHGAEVGGMIFLDMPEMGVEGWAEVLDIEECPELEVGNGQRITGTFKHTSGEVYDLRLESESEPIGVTAQHPFWSVDRGDWVSAIELEIGETLKTLDGTTVVESLIQRPDPEPVYNIEVENDHVYRVGESGVLVHNSSAPCNPCNPPGGFARSTGTTNVTASWFNGTIARPDGAVAMVTPDSTGSSPIREFNRGASSPNYWGSLTGAFQPSNPTTGRWERGHLIGNQLGGPGGNTWWNMVPLHSHANNPIMSTCEEKIRAQAELGQCIDVTVTPIYGNRKVIPTHVRIVATSQQDQDFRIDVNIPNTNTARPQC